jgi:hypothetical protein
MKQVRYFLFGGKNYRDNESDKPVETYQLLPQRQRKRNDDTLSSNAQSGWFEAHAADVAKKKSLGTGLARLSALLIWSG